jgi:hypothetical protein
MKSVCFIYKETPRPSQRTAWSHYNDQSVTVLQGNNGFYCKIRAEYVIVTCAYVLRTKSKVKCILVQALRLCKGRTAHRWSRGIALLFHGHDTRRGLGVSVTPPPLFTPGKDSMYLKQTSNCLVSEAEIARLREITSIITCYSFGNPMPVIRRMYIRLIHVFYI